MFIFKEYGIGERRYYGGIYLSIFIVCGFLVAFKLTQGDGKTARNSWAENLFPIRRLQTALKQKRFYRCVIYDFE
ncbi:DUF2913 family protein [Providencia alcalifaciens]|nr:DUF2913 family protein [Providencia alcalifaciens]MTC62407.1 DUF2913 family protein [Providencia alcalifaciens]